MKLSEKCGVFGIYGTQNDVARLVYYGLWSLQHRGQESSGIASTNGREIFCRKGQGLVAHVYRESDFKKLKGKIAIGHNRYSTFGKKEVDHSQPVFNEHSTIALVHNGNLPTVNKLKKFLKDKGISIKDRNDSELMHMAIQYWLVRKHSLKEAVEKSFPMFTGAFSLLVMSKNELVAVRDEFGIRPLCLGKINGSHVFASESCALDTIGAKFGRDVNPGEMVIVNSEGVHSYQLAKSKPQIDVFEFIYFARPDSIINGKNIYEVRKNLGRELAKESKIDADIVFPVPDSGIPSAVGYSEATGIGYEEALVKNRYIHRTFISPSQKQRTSGVSLKLNLVKSVVENKKVVVIDDSIVRGTTSKKLIELIRTGNPREVHMLVTSPPVKYPDFYGINTPKQEELIVANMSVEELRKYIGADSLHFLSLRG